jgi:hypothetical protein
MYRLMVALLLVMNTLNREAPEPLPDPEEEEVMTT